LCTVPRLYAHGGGSFISQLDFDDPALFEQPGASQREKLFANELLIFLKKIGSGSKHIPSVSTARW